MGMWPGWRELVRETLARTPDPENAAARGRALYDKGVMYRAFRDIYEDLLGKGRL